MGSNPSTESNIKQQMESNRQYANAMRENKATTEHREPKISRNCSSTDTDQLNNSTTVAMGCNKATTEHREPKISRNCSSTDTDQLNNSTTVATGCVYMGAIHSSQHTAPEAKHSSTRCCSTHEMWELPTALIVANRSQQGDEVRELPAQPLTVRVDAQLANLWRVGL
ncbi:hypothetical protein F511_41002 [Dorcoceras hygrometricum]|uniref:Uncharacterized protein n=1 Tax=Dorcoceras hygrometricum TaxID=472368 RepID=A0A2Z7CEF9_9LAMI|nr:hypothetical protein F511_41002 [Dorcoceras hygrometricum]